MLGLDIVGGFLKAIASPVTNVITGWQQRKSAKLKSDLAITEAKTTANIKKIQTGQDADISWENTSIAQSGWKDEYWTVVISLPMIMCFIPGLVEYVERGFEALSKTPEWYQWAVGIAIGSAFGVKKFVNFMATKKGD